MRAETASLSEEASLALSRNALRQAAWSIAERAELLALEMEEGRVADLGGAEALRLFAAVVRMLTDDVLVPAGHG
jgi:hypothetical protein